MAKKFDYLKRYMDDPKNPLPAGINAFYPLTEKRITDVEKRIGFQFPDQLRKFYLEIGSGFFYHNYDHSIVQRAHSNRLMTPEQVADIYLLREESELIVSSCCKYFSKKDLIFFEIGDGSDFISLKPFSDEPNKIYDNAFEVICDSFDEFIWKLYYESPTFYIEDDDNDDD